MEKKKIDRINELAKKERVGTLTNKEKAEQKSLRDEYRAEIRRNLVGNLDNTYIQMPDGTRKHVEPKN